MKDKRVTIRCILVLLMLMAFGTAIAQEIGDPLPKPEGEEVGVKMLNQDVYIKGYGDRAAGITSSMEVYKFCGTKDTLFGVYVFETDTLYLDNNPTDGKIDAIVIDPVTKGHKPVTDAPACPDSV